MSKEKIDKRQYCHTTFNPSTNMTNQEVINAFALGQTGRSSTGNLYSTGDRLVNYVTCIAQRLQDGSIVVNSTKYSPTTSKLQTYTRWTIKIYKEVVNVPINTLDIGRFVK